MSVSGKTEVHLLNPRLACVRSGMAERQGLEDLERGFESRGGKGVMEDRRRFGRGDRKEGCRRGRRCLYFGEEESTTFHCGSTETVR